MLNILSGTSHQETGQLAASINSKLKESALEVNYGIQISPSKSHTAFLHDINDSIEDAHNANNIFPYTVTSK